MSENKLQKVKKYFKKNLKKKFINFNSTFYVLFVLFVVKLNKSLQFYIDYRKFNVAIKQNQYLILLIKETLTQVVDCKYFIKLNIIVTFNKLRMHFNNKNYIIFVTFINVYKYHVLSFNLINKSFNYQHYINNVLFKYFN